MTQAGQQFQQLPMFMSAREILATHEPHAADREELFDSKKHFIGLESDEQLWDRKYKAATKSKGWHGSLADQVLAQGVKTPVTLEDPRQVETYKRAVRRDYGEAEIEDIHPEILGGHHRIAVMAKHKPDDLMPVAHATDPSEAWDIERKHGGYVG